ncbi:MAG: mraW [Pseudonocardiales bacterium]|nr:mraW [Pseudonocardiales bacterium]
MDDALDATPVPSHVPVLLARVLDLLDPALSEARPAAAGTARTQVVVDATLGLGGHAEAMLDRFPAVRLIGLDRDPDALARSGARLARFGDRVQLVHAVYHELPDVLDELRIDQIDGALFDLGVSSMQLDQAERGFSYSKDAPLDMRMDPTSGVTAEQVLADYSVPELARVLRVYGEERFALRVAQAIDRRRRQGPLTSSAELAEIVRSAIPAAARRTGGHPAKRTFQALRIEVNGELDSVRAAIPAALDRLRVGGRLVVLTYHSLEDRIVKQAIAERSTDTTPVGLPVRLADHGPRLRVVGKPGEPPTPTEIEQNPRAASARLRAAEILRESE